MQSVPLVIGDVLVLHGNVEVNPGGKEKKKNNRKNKCLTIFQGGKKYVECFMIDFFFGGGGGSKCIRENRLEFYLGIGHKLQIFTEKGCC